MSRKFERTAVAVMCNSGSDMSPMRRQKTRDPVVVYDVMREAATRLIALYAGRRTAEGLAAGDAAEIRAIRDLVERVSFSDMEAQRRVTTQLRSRAKAFGRPRGSSSR